MAKSRAGAQAFPSFPAKQKLGADHQLLNIKPPQLFARKK